MPKATRVREEFLNVWHSAAVQFSCGSTRLADDPVPLGKRWEVPAESICALWLDEPWAGGTNWLGNRIQQMLCLLNCSQASCCFFSFPLTGDTWEKQSHLLPSRTGAQGRGCNISHHRKQCDGNGSSSPRAPSHDNWSIAAGFWVSKPQSISLPPHTHGLSLSSTGIYPGRSRANPHSGQFLQEKQSSCPYLPAGTVYQIASWPLTLLFTMRKIQDLMFLLVEPFPSEAQPVRRLGCPWLSVLKPQDHIPSVTWTCQWNPFREDLTLPLYSCCHCLIPNHLIWFAEVPN